MDLKVQCGNITRREQTDEDDEGYFLPNPRNCLIGLNLAKAV
jgi:hypothetical protein